MTEFLQSIIEEVRVFFTVICPYCQKEASHSPNEHICGICGLMGDHGQWQHRDCDYCLSDTHKTEDHRCADCDQSHQAAVAHQPEGLPAYCLFCRKGANHYARHHYCSLCNTVGDHGAWQHHDCLMCLEKGHMTSDHPTCVDCDRQHSIWKWQRTDSRCGFCDGHHSTHEHTCQICGIQGHEVSLEDHDHCQICAVDRPDSQMQYQHQTRLHVLKGMNLRELTPTQAQTCAFCDECRTVVLTQSIDQKADKSVENTQNNIPNRVCKVCQKPVTKYVKCPYDNCGIQLPNYLIQFCPLCGHQIRCDECLKINPVDDTDLSGDIAYDPHVWCE